MEPPRSAVGRWLGPLAVALCVLGLGPRLALAQDDPLAPEASPYAALEDAVLPCTRLQKETLDACLEFGVLGFSDASCQDWVNVIDDLCFRTGCKCSLIGQRLNEHCRFALQMLDAALAIQLCNELVADYEAYRCPSACMWNMTNTTNITQTTCEGPEAEECMELCGNYNGCHCRRQRQTVNPDVCFGNTIVEGLNDMGVLISCLGTPRECMHHREFGRCREYKHCQPDMCVVQEVQCVAPNQCMNSGTCEPNEGRCYYQNLPDGTACNDELTWTLNDSCTRGICAGVTDYCIRFNVTCDPLNPCLTGGVCHQTSGRCTYDPQPDGEPCDDGRRYTVEDRCADGLCVGRPVDLCVEEGITCVAPSDCYEPGVCDPLTGRCSDAIPVTYDKACNGSDPTTINNRCVDGICLGELPGEYESAKFKTLGIGECADRDGRRMGRYLGDVEGGEHTCMEACRRDVQCLGYSYSYPVCSVYGTVRTRPPPDGRAWSFLEGTNPPAVAIEAALPQVPGQRAIVCRRKGNEGDTVPTDLAAQFTKEQFFGFGPMVAFCVVLMFLFFTWPCMRCLRIFFCGVPKETLVQDVPKGEAGDADRGSQASGDNYSDYSPSNQGSPSGKGAITNGSGKSFFSEGQNDEDLRAVADDPDGGGAAQPPQLPDEPEPPSVPPENDSPQNAVASSRGSRKRNSRGS